MARFRITVFRFIQLQPRRPRPFQFQLPGHSAGSARAPDAPGYRERPRRTRGAVTRRYIPHAVRPTDVSRFSPIQRASRLSGSPCRSRKNTSSAWATSGLSLVRAARLGWSQCLRERRSGQCGRRPDGCRCPANTGRRRTQVAAGLAYRSGRGRVGGARPGGLSPRFGVDPAPVSDAVDRRRPSGAVAAGASTEAAGRVLR